MVGSESNVDGNVVLVRDSVEAARLGWSCRKGLGGSGADRND